MTSSSSEISSDVELPKGFREINSEAKHEAKDNLIFETVCFQTLLNQEKYETNNAVSSSTIPAADGKALDSTDSEMSPGISFVTTSPMTKMQIIKNLFVMCTSVLLLFTSFYSLQSLHSSLNKDEGMGTFSFFISSLLMMISSMFLASISMDRLGVKLTFCLSSVTLLTLMVANLYPVWSVMVIAAVVLGIGAGPFWASQSLYIAELSKYYAIVTNTKLKDSLSIFFGIFFMCLNGSKITGNLLAALLLKQDIQTNRSMTLQEMEDCVANKQEAVSNATTLERPDDATIYTICGTWIGMATAGIIVSMFLSPITNDNDISNDGKRKPVCNKFLAAVKHFWRSGLQKILIPLSMYYGISNGFLIADFTKSIVGCTLGLRTVGSVMLCSGVFNTVSAAIIGYLTKKFGQLPFFTIAFLCFGGIQVTLLAWKPGPEYSYIFFVFAGMWGVADAILKTQILAFYGHLFANNTDAAYGNYFMLEAIGYTSSMAYSTYLSTNIKLCILLGLLVCSAISYYTAEYIDRKEAKRQEVDIDGKIDN